MVGLDRNKHAGSLSNAKRNVQIQVKTGLLGAYETPLKFGCEALPSDFLLPARLIRHIRLTYRDLSIGYAAK